MSLKRQEIERHMKIAYRELDEEIGQCACGNPRYDHSHNYPRDPFIWLIAEKQNITLLCRHHHENFENNRLWEVPEAWKIMSAMGKLLMDEPNEDRQAMMMSYFINKLVKTRAVMERERVLLPEWLTELLTVFEL